MHGNTTRTARLTVAQSADGGVRQGVAVKLGRVLCRSSLTCKQHIAPTSWVII
jgi:hypothetical protein